METNLILKLLNYQKLILETATPEKILSINILKLLFTVVGTLTVYGEESNSQ